MRKVAKPWGHLIEGAHKIWNCFEAKLLPMQEERGTRGGSCISSAWTV